MGLCPQLFEALARFGVVSGQHPALVTGKARVLDMKRGSRERGRYAIHGGGGLRLRGERAADAVGVARGVGVLDVVVLGEAAKLDKGIHAATFLPLRFSISSTSRARRRSLAGRP